MSLNTLKIATDGYLKKTTKVALVIAVAGYLNFVEVPPVPTGSGGSSNAHKSYQVFQETNEVAAKLRKKILTEDEEMLCVIKTYIQLEL